MAFDLQYEVSHDLMAKFLDLRDRVYQVGDNEDERVALVTLAMIGIARGLNSGVIEGGKITLSGFNRRGKKSNDISVTVDVLPMQEEEEPKPAPVVRKPRKAPKPIMKTSVPPVHKEVPKPAKSGKKPKFTRVGEDDYVDENGVHFRADGYARGADGNPTANPYAKIDPNLDPTAKPLVPHQGSMGTHGMYGGDDF